MGPRAPLCGSTASRLACTSTGARASPTASGARTRTARAITPIYLPGSGTTSRAAAPTPTRPSATCASRNSRSTPAQSRGTRRVRTACREAEISPPSTPRRRTERPSRSLVGLLHGLGSMARRTSTTMCGRMGRRWTTTGGLRGSLTTVAGALVMRTVEGTCRAAATAAGTTCMAARAAARSLLTFADTRRPHRQHHHRQHHHQHHQWKCSWPPGSR